ncbi:MAG TPA: ATP-binding protein [Jiangellales bacterium]|nr:ATP-binding protein [Jiangellales bacterium]
MAAEWFRRLSLRARLTTVATILVAGALAAGAILLSAAVQRSLLTAVDEAARQRAVDVALLVDTGRLPDPIPVEAGTPLVQVVDADDRVVAASPGGDRLVPILLPDDVAAARAGESRRLDGSRLGMSGELYVVGAPAGEEDEPLTVLVARSLAEVTDATRVVRVVLFTAAPLLVGAFAIACWLLVGQALRSVEALRRGAEDIRTTREHRRLPIPAAEDEIHRLAVTLNDMLDRLERSNARQRAFVSDAAHELRSPLAAIRTQLEVARAHPADADWNQTSADALADVERLSRLVADLLVLARADEAPRRRFEPVDLAQVVDDIVARYEASRVPVRRVGVASLPLIGDVDALGRIASNLIDNAVRHAASVVTVDVARSDGGVAELTVTDDGPGIPAADAERVFDRFTRLDEARSRDAGGTGLGLPIVRELVRMHGGTVVLQDNGPGLRAVVHLPIGAVDS